MDSKYSDDQPEYTTSYTPSYSTDDQESSTTSSQHYMSAIPGEVQDYMYDGSSESSESSSESE
jgi:hypothetical protein